MPSFRQTRPSIYPQSTTNCSLKTKAQELKGIGISIICVGDIVMKEQGLKIGVATIITMLVTLSLMCTCEASTSSNIHPLILIPGNGGNQLEARLTPQYKPSSFICDTWNPLVKKKKGWFRLWFDSSVLLAPFTQCFAERMTLHYHQELDDYYNTPGVQTRVPHFGSTHSLLYLNPHLKHVTEYMASLVDSLEQIGYIEGETLFGAPYDFRYGLAAQDHPSRVGSKFLKDLKNLIEEASTSNGGKPVILLSHSLGGLFVLQLLNRNPSSWRKKFIKHFVALSAPWGGAIDEMLTFASGNTLGVPLVDPLIVRGEQRSSESNLWLLPNPKIFGLQKPLVITPNRGYSAMDMVDFLKDIDFPEGVYPYETRILPLIENIDAPEVPITCIIGTGVRTSEKLFYRNGDFNKRPEVSYGDGDGTVSRVSLLALQSLWKYETNQSLKVIEIDGVSHISILKDEVALDEIRGEISRINSHVQLGLSKFFWDK
ncbi:lecithin-cholesterol acyltransferase-like 1 [Gastrolobium bilobum]|uniref:lecithin-cholesterol acyltransferase-like 1 n=1 Tax=Gastrolobium bilobum TaxID=150636 RepID=UPI002AB1B86E|nr:lecithin-cholesterol acyltransferase-like 1 [Gastrolobium bilobum]